MLTHILGSNLRLPWSPEKIAEWLKQTYPDDKAHLRRTRVMRRSRHYTQKTDNHGRIVDAVLICERPAAVED